uniref:Uncharacterized protein n=1 Tax=Rhizophora mucronata TaxID=61149 RepID=A0A2P2JRZ9_RHIMU
MVGKQKCDKMVTQEQRQIKKSNSPVQEIELKSRLCIYLLDNANSQPKETSYNWTLDSIIIHAIENNKQKFMPNPNSAN